MKKSKKTTLIDVFVPNDCGQAQNASLVAALQKLSEALQNGQSLKKYDSTLMGDGAFLFLQLETNA